MADEADEENYQGQLALWQANLNRHLLGKKGQRYLRELKDALLALPEKRLIAGALAKNGEVCAIGALIVKRKQATLGELEGMEDDSADYAKSLGIPYLMAWAVVCENDYTLEHCTPEGRYERLLNWVEARLRGEPDRKW